eukprot:CAMPEP_0183482544 /NCGR_PEP_ID=MMETSP0370-20130417/176822_1 /TAXON_ID=268820 /ORGANISM="Peridinium aciculiferum, Strain PAER-2" /LENGTH=58 /DNA_ID=CAMNT_0025675737 /DNA_START=316 /DNA_END=488 /DNA_ORIENTATION=+
MPRCPAGNHAKASFGSPPPRGAPPGTKAGTLELSHAAPPLEEEEAIPRSGPAGRAGRS